MNKGGRNTEFNIIFPPFAGWIVHLIWLKGNRNTKKKTVDKNILQKNL